MRHFLGEPSLPSFCSYQPFLPIPLETDVILRRNRTALTLVAVRRLPPFNVLLAGLYLLALIGTTIYLWLFSK
jgi:hypothetical protein